MPARYTDRNRLPGGIHFSGSGYGRRHLHQQQRWASNGRKPIPNGNTVTVNLHNVSNAQTLGITLTNVNNGIAMGDVGVTMGVFWEM